MKIVWNVLVGIFGIFLALKLVPGTELKIIPGQSSILGLVISEQWQILAAVGTILGLINFFIKPILDKITLPLKILTLGLFSLILNMAIIWFLELTFAEFEIKGFIPLLKTTLIVWLINIFLK